MRCLASLPSPFGAVPGGATTRAFFHGDCLDLLARLEPDSVDVVVTSPPYNLGIRYRSCDDALPRQAYLLWTRRWLAAVARVLAPDGSLPQRRREANRSLGRPRRRTGGPPGVHPPEHDPLDQVDRHRSRGGRRRGAGPRSGRRSLQAHQQRAIRQRLSRVRLPFHAPRRDRTRPDRHRRAVSGQVERHALGGRGRRSALPRQHVVPALRHDQEPRQGPPASGDRSRRGCRSSASGCTAALASAWSWIRSPAWGARLSPAPASTSTSPASTWTTCIWQKRSAARRRRRRPPPARESRASGATRPTDRLAGGGETSYACFDCPRPRDGCPRRPARARVGASPRGARPGARPATTVGQGRRSRSRLRSGLVRPGRRPEGSQVRTEADQAVRLQGQAERRRRVLPCRVLAGLHQRDEAAAVVARDVHLGQHQGPGRQRRQHLVEPRLPRAARSRVPDPERLEAQAAAAHGLLDTNSGVARRATFVVDKGGIVRKVDVGREALDPSGVVGMCKTLETQ